VIRDPEKRKAYGKTYRATHLRDRTKYMKTYRAAHRERDAAYYKTYHAAHKDDRKSKQWLREYGLSRAAFDAMIENQHGTCAICRKPGWGGKEPRVDHDHTTGKVRGILCNHCNLALGHIRDDPKIASSMAHYLDKVKVGKPKKA
jgi:hypothetical protein